MKESAFSQEENYEKQRGSRSNKLNERDDEYAHTLLNPKSLKNRRNCSYFPLSSLRGSATRRAKVGEFCEINNYHA